jgi:hypothetical protein
MDIEAIEETLEAWARAQTGLPAAWRNKPATMQIKLPARIELDGPTLIESPGQDWLMHEDASDTQVQPTVVGNREFTVTIRAVGRSQAGNSRGQFWIERLRASLKKPSVLALFQDANIAVVTAGPTAQYDAAFDNRVESIAAMEVRFATTIAETDELADAIAGTRLTSHIQDTAGTELPVPPNVEDAEIPDV